MRPFLVHAHASADELNKVYTADLPIHAAPGPLMAALAELRVPGSRRWAERTERARAAFVSRCDLPQPPGELDMRSVMAHLQETLPADAILTNGAGNFAIWPNKIFGFHGRQRLLAPQSGAMGYGLPAGIAARVLAPERTVVTFAGDGDIQMVLAELATARQAGACPIVLVLNNGSYGTIRMHQETHYPHRVSFTELHNPDFPAIARACGLHGESVTETPGFAPAFERAQAAGGGLIELVLPVEAITPRSTIDDLRRSKK